MNKIIEFGKKAMFYVRVLSGYELHRIRSHRLLLEQRLRSAELRKQAVKKIPEQMVLSELRRVVEEMQTLNKSLEDMETNINEYLKPLDKEAETIIGMQMEKEKEMAKMMGSVYKQALLEKASTEAAPEVKSSDMETMKAMFKCAFHEKAEEKTAMEMKRTHDDTKVASHTR